jgi:hypothetical protein
VLGLDATMKVFLTTDVDLPCDTVLHNLDMVVRPLELLQLGEGNEFALLRALRRTDLAPAALLAPQWMLAAGLPVECVVRPWAATSTTSKGARLAVQLECVDEDVGDTFDAAVLHRAVARQLARQRCVKAGLLFATPVAGQHVTVRVLQADASEQPLVQFVKRPKSRTVLQNALVSCYRACLQPRIAYLLAARDQPHCRLLLMAHAALMPIDLCTLLVEELGSSCTALTAEDIVIGASRVGASSTSDAIVVSGLEQLSQSDSFVMLRWLERLTSVLVILVAHSLDEVEPGLISPSRVGAAFKLNSPNQAQRSAILATLTARLEADDALAMAAAAEATGGFSVRDLQRFCSVWVATGSVEQAKAQVVPSALAHEDRFEPSGVSWQDIKGCDEARSVLHRAILWPMRHPGETTPLEDQIVQCRPSAESFICHTKLT